MEVTKTSIPGLLHIKLDLFADERGNFREAWQREKMIKLGLPDFKPVQFNVSESKYGTIRGIHAEPWDKFIHPAFGTIFAALVDLRKHEKTFGQVATFALDPTQALFLPEGLGNSFQATSEIAIYTYLVTKHWTGVNPYPAVAFDDPALHIAWPVPKEKWIISEKDMNNLPLREAFA